MRRIQQRENCDCAIACIAMFVGVSYKKVYKIAKKNWVEWEENGGTHRDEIANIMRELGCIPVERTYYNNKERAIIMLPSLRDPLRLCHAIVYDPEANDGKGGYLDPSRGRRWGRDEPVNQWLVAIQDLRRPNNQRSAIHEIAKLSDLLAKGTWEAKENGLQERD